MVRGESAHEQEPVARELSFLERMGLLVDQQWNWRKNQALGRRLKNAKLRTTACIEEIDFRGARGLDKSVIRALVQESAWVGTHENVFVVGPTLQHSREMTQACSPKATHQTGLERALAGAASGTGRLSVACLPDIGQWQALGEDDTDLGIPCPRARRVLRVGHPIRAQVGHSS